MTELSKETEEYLNQERLNNTETLEVEVSAPSVTPSKRFTTKPQTDSISEMREKLEIRKLQIELDKLEKPSTNIDYFEKMLTLQNENFKAQLEMQKSQNDLKLEIEKLKLGDGEDSMMGYIQMLAPFLPQIMANLTKPKVNNEKSKNDSNTIEINKTIKPSDNIQRDNTNNTNNNETIEGEKMQEDEENLDDDDFDYENATEQEQDEWRGKLTLEEYKEEIQCGTINFETALKDFKTTPYAKMVSEEQFKTEFEKIKNG
jgi:hypothetical protein